MVVREGGCGVVNSVRGSISFDPLGGSGASATVNVCGAFAAVDSGTIALVDVRGPATSVYGSESSTAVDNT